ncbi:MAG TPA: hypothetical protein VFT44_07820 [Pyrinomonadaceae bacterium]|nr:hypothetical protein [Pyrinomonadaceae bacterium]
MDKWPGAAVAIALMALVGAIAVAGLRYAPAQFDKIWGALASLVGLITGVVATYFFTKEVSRQSAKQLMVAQRRLEEAERKVSISDAAATRLFYSTTPEARQEIRTDEAVNTWLKSK